VPPALPGARLRKASDSWLAQLNDRRSAVRFAHAGCVESRPQVRPERIARTSPRWAWPRAGPRASCGQRHGGHQQAENRSRSWAPLTKPNRVQPSSRDRLGGCMKHQAAAALGRAIPLAPGELHLRSPRPGAVGSRPQRLPCCQLLRPRCPAASDHGVVFDDHPMLPRSGPFPQPPATTVCGGRWISLGRYVLLSCSAWAACQACWPATPPGAPRCLELQLP